MRLRLLAPVPIDFSLRPGAATRDPVHYREFWEGCQRRMQTCRESPSSPCTVLPHAAEPSRYNRYERIDTHSLDRALELVIHELDPDALAIVDHGSDARTQRAATANKPLDDVACLSSLVDRVECRVYDHSIAIVEASTTDLWPWVEQVGHASIAEALQKAAVELGACIARAVHTAAQEEVIGELRRARKSDDVLLPPLPESSSLVAFGEPLWVTRTLLLERREWHDREELVPTWIQNVAADSRDWQQLVGELLAGDRNHSIRWLNYVFVAEDGALEREPNPFDVSTDEATGGLEPGSFADAWEALRYAQYYYAALETMNARLMDILARSHAADSTPELNRLREELERAAGRARMLVIERHDVTKYLKRSVRRELGEILDYWGFEQLIENPVQAKLKACDERLRELEAKRSERSARYTDLILLALGVTTILSTAIGLAEFGRVMASDPALSAYDVGRGDRVAWFAAQPADAILLVSGLISLVLVVLYLYFRRFHDK